MKYLAVDYGKKKIGLAISDSMGKVAMPFGIFENNDSFEEYFKKIIADEHIDEVVIGKSVNLQGENNSIQKEIDVFVKKVENMGVKTHSINEVFTSMESKWGTTKKVRRNEKKSRKAPKTERVDDKAASMILKTFLQSC